jgi:hypothetical protein
MSFKRFDVAAELQNLRSTPPKAPKVEALPPPAAANFSHFSHFSRGEPVKTQNQQPAPWPCPHCGNPAEIEDVFPSLDEERTLTMWRCEPCRVVAVTPNTLREPPTWVSGKEQ